MKKIISSSSLAFVFSLMVMLSLSACSDKEATPGDGTIPDAFTQKVVIEEFTGEWCGACPAASNWMEGMSDQHGNKVIGVGVHAGSQHDRYKDNPACKTAYSFLYNHLRHPGLSSIGFPNLMFNRNLNPANNQVINSYTGKANWTSKVNQELGETAKGGLAINTSFDGANINVTVKYHLKKALGSDHAITVYLTEDDLDGSEQVSAGAGFMHKHTLRGILTAKDGTAIDGDAVGQTMELVLDPFEWTGYNKSKLKVIAFINHLGADYTDREIINGQIVKAGENQDFD
jgi:hypothetical protein